jgi:hypothetical protein
MRGRLDFAVSVFSPAVDSENPGATLSPSDRSPGLDSLPWIMETRLKIVAGGGISPLGTTRTGGLLSRFAVEQPPAPAVIAQPNFVFSRVNLYRVKIIYRDQCRRLIVDNSKAYTEYVFMVKRNDCR